MLLGVDIVNISQIKNIIGNIKLNKNKGVLSNVFSKNEIKNCRSLKNTYRYYAKLFAGKEAFLKALGTGLSGEILFSDIEFMIDENGSYCVNCYGQAKKELIKMGIKKINFSLSYSRENAVALVILEN